MCLLPCWSLGDRPWVTGQELSLGRIYLFIQQIFAEGLLCAENPPRSGDRGPGVRRKREACCKNYGEASPAGAEGSGQGKQQVAGGLRETSVAGLG